MFIYSFFQKVWGVLLHIAYDTKWRWWTRQTLQLGHAFSEQRKEGKKDSGSKENLDLGIEVASGTLYLWLRENVSLPMVFCSSHWNLNPAVRLFHRKESLGCRYFRFCSLEKWMEIPLLHDHWYIIPILSKTILQNKAQVGQASNWRTVYHVPI